MWQAFGLALPFPHGIQIHHTGDLALVLAFGFAFALHVVGLGHLPISSIGIGKFALALALTIGRVELVRTVPSKVIAST